MRPELYVWKAPEPADAAAADTLVQVALADPDSSPFEASDEVGWFYRELTGDLPPVWNPDRKPSGPIPPNRFVAVPLQPETARETFENVYSIAAKYDLIVYDPERRRVGKPLAEMAAYASATFWPRGAIRAAVAGTAGGLVAIGAWLVGIPILSGVVIIAGAFMFAMAVFTFVHEGRVAKGRG